MNRGALRASCILLFALLGVLPAAAIPPTKAQQAAIAALPDAYRAWLEEVEIILTDEERTTFLALAKDYQRDAFIERFWAVRDTVKRTARNEFRDAWEASLQQAKAMFGGVKDGRTRAMLLNGIPDERVESNCSLILVPTEVWFYGPSQHFREGHVVVLYRKWAAGPFRLWEPAEEIDVLFTGESGPLGDQHSLGEIASPGDKGCGDDEHARRVLAGIAWVLGQAADWIYVQQMIDQPPKPPGAEWVSAFNSYSTDIPAGAPPLPAKLDLAFPGRMQSRTVVRGVVTVPPGAAAQARLGEARSYNLLLNGEVLANGELLDSFRYKFDLSAAEASADAAPEAIPLVFERPLRPGDYTLIVKLEDVNAGRFYREERPLSVPLMATAAPAASMPRTPEEAEAARVLAEADAALRSGETTIKLVPPLGELRAGMQRFDTLTTGPGIDRVTFALDGKPVLTKRSLPFSVELDLGTVPRTRTLAVAAYDAQGNTLAADEIQINATGNRFRVHLIEPQKGKRYESSLLAHAEVDIPEEETLERVEIYLDEARIATLYQPPWVHPVVLPKGAGLSYVRAVAYLADGSSTESLVFVNAPEEMAQINVDFVELYATVLDRQGHPLTAGLSARDFAVSEDGARQQIARCEPVSDLPIHAAVAIDISASMAPHLEKVQAAALQFLQGMMRPKDRAEVITFNDHPAQVVKFTRDLKTLAGGLAGLKAERGTSLYDSLIFSFYTFNGLKGRRALLLLSDGRDEGSRFGYEEALDFARRAGVTVYSIGLGDEVDKRKLTRIAEETGGRAFFPRKAEELAAIYAGIEAELRSQVLIAYQSTSTRNDPGFRVVDLKVNRPGVEVKTIRGYYP